MIQPDYNYETGDVVRMLTGRVDWEIVRPGYAPGSWWIKSGMSGRHKRVYHHQIKPWKPNA